MKIKGSIIADEIIRDLEKEKQWKKWAEKQKQLKQRNNDKKGK